MKKYLKYLLISFLICILIGSIFLIIFHTQDKFYDTVCNARWAFWHAVVPGVYIIMTATSIVSALIVFLFRRKKSNNDYL